MESDILLQLPFSPYFFFVVEGTEYSRVMLYVNSLYNMGRGQGKGEVPSFTELAENDPDI